MNLKKIRFLDLKKINLQPAELSINNIKNYLLGGEYILEKNVEKFEKVFANFNGAKYCVGVNSGHDALKIALMSCGVGKNDQVIVPSQTFISTWFAVSEIGATPIPCDINLSDCLINVLKLPRKPKKIKAIIAVNLFGNLCNYKYLKKYCKKNNIILIEDASQSHGAYFLTNRKKIYSDLSCYSFYPGKNLGSIFDSGAIITNSAQRYKLLKKIRNYGSSKKYHHEILGMNSRMNGISGIFLKNKLKFLKKEINTRGKQIMIYKNYLDKSNVSFFKFDKEQQPSNHIFAILVKNRDKLKEYLEKNNIETIIHYPIIPPLQKFYKEKYNKYKKKFVNAELISKTILSLPLGNHLKLNQIKYVSKKINEFFI